MKNATTLTSSGALDVRSMAEWLGTADGKRKIQESLQRSQESVKLLNEARAVDPKLLQEPVTL
jgi:hypothetical protein